MDHINRSSPKEKRAMYQGRRGAPWLPALIAGGIGAAILSKRARWHAMQGGPGHHQGGFGPRRGIPPMFEEMLNTWHKQAHGETPPAPEPPAAPGPQS
jgi:hypothetical protein